MKENQHFIVNNSGCDDPLVVDKPVVNDEQVMEI